MFHGPPCIMATSPFANISITWSLFSPSEMCIRDRGHIGNLFVADGNTLVLEHDRYEKNRNFVGIRICLLYTSRRFRCPSASEFFKLSLNRKCHVSLGALCLCANPLYASCSPCFWYRYSLVLRQNRQDLSPVSYTHLDVYKRQVLWEQYGSCRTEYNIKYKEQQTKSEYSEQKA